MSGIYALIRCIWIRLGVGDGNKKGWLIKWSIRALFAFAVFALVASIGINILPFFFPETEQIWIPYDPLSDMTSFVVSVTALVAMLAYRQDRKKNELENKRSRSEFFLRQAIIALDEAYSFLKPSESMRLSPNMTLAWLGAARRILESRKLAGEIELKDFKIPYRIHEDKLRRRLRDSLSTVDDKGNKYPLPPQYFYGKPDWRTSDSLDDLANEVFNKRIEATKVDINRVSPLSESLVPYLNVKSVITVYDFMERYPEDYNDLLHEVEIWKDDWQYSHRSIDKGARHYVAHFLEKYREKYG